MITKFVNADNQQGSRCHSLTIDPSETTRRTPFPENVIKAYF